MARRCAVTGKGVMTGNNVSHANNKSRRRWIPNLQETSLLSETLNETVRVRLTPHGLRTIDHKGGLDAWVLGTRSERLSPELRRLKKRLIAAQKAGSAA